MIFFVFGKQTLLVLIFQLVGLAPRSGDDVGFGFGHDDIVQTPSGAGTSGIFEAEVFELVQNFGHPFNAITSNQCFHHPVNFPAGNLAINEGEVVRQTIVEKQTADRGFQQSAARLAEPLGLGRQHFNLGTQMNLAKVVSDNRLLRPAENLAFALAAAMITRRPVTTENDVQFEIDNRIAVARL